MWSFGRKTFSFVRDIHGQSSDNGQPRFVTISNNTHTHYGCLGVPSGTLVFNEPSKNITIEDQGSKDVGVVVIQNLLISTDPIEISFNFVDKQVTMLGVTKEISWDTALTKRPFSLAIDHDEIAAGVFRDSELCPQLRAIRGNLQISNIKDVERVIIKEENDKTHSLRLLKDNFNRQHFCDLVCRDTIKKNIKLCNDNAGIPADENYSDLEDTWSTIDIDTSIDTVETINRLSNILDTLQNNNMYKVTDDNNGENTSTTPRPSRPQNQSQLLTIIILSFSAMFFIVGIGMSIKFSIICFNTRSCSTACKTMWCVEHLVAEQAGNIRSNNLALNSLAVRAQVENQSSAQDPLLSGQV